MKNIAVVMAHYHRNGKVDDDTLKLIKLLSKSVSRFILVSTSFDTEYLAELPGNVELIVRPNIGYDFYSYKTGIDFIGDFTAYDELLVINDSCYFSNPEKFVSRILDTDSIDGDILGLVGSGQFRWHVQSFCFLFRKRVLSSYAFIDFWKSIKLLSDKMEIIFSYEIGMTAFFSERGFLVREIFRVDFFSTIVATWRIAGLGARLRLVEFLVILLVPNRRKQTNPSHFLWDKLLLKFGFIKKEILRDNPNSLDLTSLINLVGNDEGGRVNLAAELMRSESSPDVSLRCYKESSIYCRHGGQIVVDGSVKRDVAVVLHLFHYDLLPIIKNALTAIVEPFDIFVSVRTAEDACRVFKDLKLRGVRVFPFVENNVGRDVWPFISLLNSNVLDSYKCICKIHSKKSVYSELGDEWRRRLFYGVLPSAFEVLRIIDMFKRDPTLGLLGAEDSFVSNPEYWGGNRERVCDLAERMGGNKDNVELGFFAGTMFWFRPAALEKLVKLGLSASDFEAELGQRDATLAHALERVFPIAVNSLGYRVSTIEKKCVPLDARDYSGRKVLVL